MVHREDQHAVADGWPVQRCRHPHDWPEGDMPSNCLYYGDNLRWLRNLEHFPSDQVAGDDEDDTVTCCGEPMDFVGFAGSRDPDILIADHPDGYKCWLLLPEPMPPD